MAETEYLVLLSRDLGDLPAQAAEMPLREAGEIARMLHALRRKVDDRDS